jgi:EAL domain-containing protein (putative c-di-GMP-specific phosphodiesterase class I)/GGDEF domain-containing protein
MNDASTMTKLVTSAHRLPVTIVVGAAVAALLPAAALWLAPPPVAWIAVAASLAILAFLAHLVRPLARVVRILADCLAAEGPAEETAADPRGAAGLVGIAGAVAARLSAMRQRLTNRHPVSGLPTREPFLAALMGAVGEDAPETVLAVVRFSDYDRLAAFDQGAADRALAAFAARLRASVPPARPVAQIDRDCFAVWFAGAPDRDEAAREMKALAYVLGQELAAGEFGLTPSIAMGAAVQPDDGVTPAELLTRATAALEIGRLSGRPLAFFSAQGSASARERFSLEQDLRGAVARDELVLHYQPVVDLEAGRVVGAEALLRWKHPRLGLVPPGMFIPILEQTPMMAEVGLWVLNTACRELCAWRDQGLGELKIAVNLSPAQCRDPRLSEVVMRTLERHGLPTSCLELELTETAAMEDADHIRSLLADLRAHGVDVAIDDFGAGYSSLTYLKNLPFSKLKIDREFVTDVNRRRDSRAICAALIALARGLDIKLLAEGVETLEEVGALRSMGVRLFQGFFFSKPLEASAFPDAVREPAWREALGHTKARRAAG